ncbi:YniB family protein, partial [Symbiopectobacterium sp.]|uniref:YniB family protein n=1 Tax=Symbiopectobacterium sp. TaxID=2952789 RepID=UPI003F30343D
RLRMVTWGVLMLIGLQKAVINSELQNTVKSRKKKNQVRNDGYNSPMPDFSRPFAAASIMFWIIYLLIFVGLELQVSGARMSRQARAVREGIEDQVILEKMKGSEGRTREELASRAEVPHHTIFLQYFPLYIMPIITAFAGYLVLRLLGVPV